MTMLDILLVLLIGIFIGAGIALSFARVIITKMTDDMINMFVRDRGNLKENF